MGQVPAMVQVHAHNGVPGLTHSKLHGHIGLGSGMGLHIHILTAEKFPGPLYGKPLHLIHTFTAAVVSLSRITFGIFVGQRAPHGCHDRLADPVLRGDQLKMAVLPLLLVHNHLRDLRVNISHILQ